MIELKSGDKVERLDGGYFSFGRKTLTVARTEGDRVWIKETGAWVDKEGLVKAHYKPKHVHHDLIIEWAKGAEVEYLDKIGNWLTASAPTWNRRTTYRIKPTNPNAEKLKELEDKARELADEIAKLKEEDYENKTI